MPNFTVVRTWRGVQAERVQDAFDAARPGEHNASQAIAEGAVGVPDNYEALLNIIDVLWGELPGEQVLTLAAEYPEIYQACQHVHRIVSHEVFGQ